MTSVPPEDLTDAEFVDWLETIPSDSRMHSAVRRRAYKLAGRPFSLTDEWRHLVDPPKMIAAEARLVMIRNVTKKLS